MGPPGSRKRVHTAKKKYFRKYTLATKHRSKDLDQVRDDLAKRQRMTEEGVDAEESTKQFDEDLPGGGRFYCMETARYFISQDALDKHKLSKQFKQRVKELEKEAVYNQEAADAAIGKTKEKLPSLRDTRMSET